MIDTHCHLTFDDYAGRVADELAGAAAQGVTGAITVSTTTANCTDCLALAHAHERVWCSTGVHPLYADQGPHDWDAMTRVAADPKCVAWGELGLDKHYSDPPLDIQRSVLHDQLEAIERAHARGIDPLPVIIHCREAFDELIPILRASSLPADRYVFHCFTGNPDQARAVLDLGAMISFTGVVTYRNAKDVQAAAALVPDDRIMVETDAPFLSPDPHRGKRPCKIAWTRHTAEFLAKLRNTDFPTFHTTLNTTTKRFFKIPATPPSPSSS